MALCNHPTKQQVREYMEHRRTDRTPPPAPDQIRRELGWKLIEAQRDGKMRA